MKINVRTKAGKNYEKVTKQVTKLLSNCTDFFETQRQQGKG